MPSALWSDAPARPPGLGPRYILLGPNAAHGWVVKDNHGAIGAVFRAPDVALRFARREAEAHGCRVVVDCGPVELDCLQP